MLPLAAKRVLAFALLLALAGCSTPGYQPTEETLRSFADTRNAVEAVTQQVEKTLEALDAVISSAGGDSRKAFRTYSKEVDVFDSQVADVRARVSDLHSRAGKYFELWRKEAEQIRRRDLQEMTTQRSFAVQEFFERIADALQSIDEPFSDFTRELQDIELYLAFNLNRSGIQQLRPKIAATRRAAEQVDVYARRIIEAMDLMSGAISPRGRP